MVWSHAPEISYCLVKKSSDSWQSCDKDIMTEAKKTESSLQEKTLALSGDMAYLEQSGKKNERICGDDKNVFESRFIKLNSIEFACNSKAH